jgi:hypothetical protein
MTSGVQRRTPERPWSSDRPRYLRYRPGRAKNHPHFYCDAATLLGLLAGFELITLSQQLQERRPGSRRWHIIAERSG